MSAEQLKPCPFCGGVDIYEGHVVNHDTGEEYGHCVNCDACAISVPVAAWNRRAPAQQGGEVAHKSDCGIYKDPACPDAPCDCSAAPTPPASPADAVDAARWRAFVGCARVRVLGSAGLKSDVDPNGNPFNGFAHIGLELWTKHTAPTLPGVIELLEKFADAAMAQAGGEHGVKPQT